MPEKPGAIPLNLLPEVQSMELDPERNGSYKLLLGRRLHGAGRLYRARSGTSLESLHRRGEFALKIVGEGDFADGPTEAYRQY